MFFAKLYARNVFFRPQKAFMEPNKYLDNKLAEEFDAIELLDDTLAKDGLPRGTVGTLIRAYTGKSTPLYARFVRGDGKAFVRPLSLYGFRVLNERSPRDLRAIFSLRQAQTHKAT